jgi:hypothetical protein
MSYPLHKSLTSRVNQLTQLVNHIQDTRLDEKQWSLAVFSGRAR